METDCAAAVMPSASMTATNGIRAITIAGETGLKACLTALRKRDRLNVERAGRRAESAASGGREDDGARVVELRQMPDVRNGRDLVVRRAGDVHNRRRINRLVLAEVVRVQFDDA